MNSKARFHLAHACIVSPKRGSALNTRRNDFIRKYIERVTSRKRKNRFGSRCDGVPGEGRVLGVPNFHSWARH